jgi:hypothetical protein
MELHDTETAVKFGTRKDCQQWIDERVIRFKLKMVKVGHPDLARGVTFVPQKCDGEIVHRLEEGFRESGTDEPLGNYAAPSKHDGQWMAVMGLQG